MRARRETGNVRPLLVPVEHDLSARPEGRNPGRKEQSAGANGSPSGESHGRRGLLRATAQLESTLTGRLDVRTPTPTSSTSQGQEAPRRPGDADSDPHPSLCLLERALAGRPPDAFINSESIVGTNVVVCYAAHFSTRSPTAKDTT